MGCSISENSMNNTAFLNRKLFIDISRVFQEQIRNMKVPVSCILSAYLIPTNSLPIFLSLIKKYKILDDLEKNPDEIVDIYSTKEFPEFESNKDLKIINSFSQCKNFIKENNNEFIIVNDNFIKYMKINNSENQKVLVCIDNEKKVKELKFNESNNSQNIILEEKSTGIFKCRIIEASIINNINNTNNNYFSASWLGNNNNNQIIKSIDLNFTWDKLIKEGIVCDNDFFLQENQHKEGSDISKKIYDNVKSKELSSS